MQYSFFLRIRKLIKKNSQNDQVSIRVFFTSFLFVFRSACFLEFPRAGRLLSYDCGRGGHHRAEIYVPRHADPSPASLHESLTPSGVALFHHERGSRVLALLRSYR